MGYEVGYTSPIRCPICGSRWWRSGGTDEAVKYIQRYYLCDTCAADDTILNRLRNMERFYTEHTPGLFRILFLLPRMDAKIAWYVRGQKALAAAEAKTQNARTKFLGR